MGKLLYVIIALSLTACGLTPPDQVNKSNGNNGGTSPFTNFSTHTTFSGNLAIAVKPVGGFISSVGTSGGTTFTTTTDRGTFTTTTALSTTVGTAILYEKVTDTLTNATVSQLLIAGNATSVVTAVQSLTP
jgi:hypothetical protein